MLAKHILSGLIALGFHSAYAQTGPAGVGNNTNNTLWLKANSGTSTTTDGVGISAWNDQSGSSNHVSQGTANRQPLYRASVLNGMPALEFDNITGTNDKLVGNDSPTLDNTTGITIFTVTRPRNLDGSTARSIIAKRVNVGVDQSYMFFYFTTNYMFCDVVSNDNRFSTNPTIFANNTNYILDLVYDGSQAIAGNRSKIFSAQTMIRKSSESSTNIPDFTSQFFIGSTHDVDNRPFGGYIAEVILYREALDSTKRIIVDNYLSSKYAIALSTNDYYSGDTPGNGNFDFDVAGIGQTTAGVQQTQFDPTVTLGLGITYKSGFENGDFVMTGQNTTTNASINTDIAVVSGGPIDRRWQRIWYIDVTNSSTSILTDVVFDLSAGGFTLTASTPSNYKLLYRATNSGNWTIVATANAVSGDQITFTDFSFTGNAMDGYYTIGTLNNATSPLPIELISFNAVLNDSKVDLSWTTASETNNDFFTIERSKNGLNWENILQVDGAGNSNTVINYFDADQQPLTGISYYRLKQTDFDGNFSYSNVEVVHNFNESSAQINAFPNPNDGNSFNLEFTGFGDEEVLVVVRDIQGKEYYSKMYLVNDNNTIYAVSLTDKLPVGTYLITASSDENLVSKKIVVQ